jgi:hypothetical protein
MNKAPLRLGKYKFHFHTADFREDFIASNRSENSNIVNKPNVDKTNEKLMAAYYLFHASLNISHS